MKKITIQNHDADTRTFDYTVEVGEFDLYFEVGADNTSDQMGFMYSERMDDRFFLFSEDAARELYLPFDGDMRSVYSIFELTVDEARTYKRGMDNDAMRERKLDEKHYATLRAGA